MDMRTLKIHKTGCMHSRIHIATDTIIVNIIVGVQGTRVFLCAQFVATKQLQLLCAWALATHGRDNVPYIRLSRILFIRLHYKKNMHPL